MNRASSNRVRSGMEKIHRAGSKSQSLLLLAHKGQLLEVRRLKHSRAPCHQSFDNSLNRFGLFALAAEIFWLAVRSTLAPSIAYCRTIWYRLKKHRL